MKKYLIAAIAAVTILTGCKTPVQDIGSEYKESSLNANAPDSTVITISPKGTAILGIEEEIKWKDEGFTEDDNGLYISKEIDHPDGNKVYGKNYLILRDAKRADIRNVLGNSSSFTDYKIKLTKTNENIACEIIKDNGTSKIIIITKKGFEGIYNGSPKNLGDYLIPKLGKNGSNNINIDEKVDTTSKVFIIPNDNKEIKPESDLGKWLSDNFDKLYNESTRNNALLKLEEYFTNPTGKTSSAKFSGYVESSFTCEVYRPNNK